MEEIYQSFEAKKAEALKRVEAKEAELGTEKEKEILKEAVTERISTAQPLPPAQKQAIAQKAQQLKAEPKERQIELLAQMAFEKGVIEAVETAKNLDNPYLLDEFHDVLVDQLYSKLVEQGKLKQV